MENLLKTHPAYKKARDAYGLDFELNMLIEECAEVIQSVLKLKRNPNSDHVKHLLEEIGDTENMFQQM